MHIGLILAIVFVASILIGVPIAVSIGVASVIGLLASGMPLSYIGKTAYTAVDSFTLIAIPMFVLSGALMERGGLTRRLIGFSTALVGRAPGGLATVTVAACTLFAAISGSGPATTAAIGSILIPAMIQDRYPPEFAGGIAACSGGIGVVIPPSILMIMYGITAEVSITGLFVAGVFPGILLAIFLTLAVIIVSKKRGYASRAEKTTLRRILRAANEAKWSLLAPIIILGGIYGGVFTVTEASVVAVLYSLIAGFVIYRDLTWKGLLDSLIYTARISGTLMLVVVTGRIFGRLLTILQIPQAVSNLLVTNIHSPVVLVLLVDLMLLFIGMWMESITQIIILTPLLLPAMISAGIDPIQFGVMFTIACEIGYETPPLGVNLFVASEIADTTIEKISKEALIFAFAEITVLVLISLIPQISVFLPRLLGLT